MSGLPNGHPVREALMTSKLSADLVDEFCSFISDFPDWEQQAVYLLSDKGMTIEEIVQDLYGVEEKDQPFWKKPADDELFLEEDPVIPESPEVVTKKYDDYSKALFKDWKQEHGFESIPVEIGDIHTFIRFRQVYTEDQEEKFEWTFKRARYGKRGWGNERPLKSITKSLLDNNNNPGWVVKTFLEENKLLTDANHQPREGEIPNPLVLSSRDSHTLLFLLMGHPFVFYGEDNTIPIRHSHTKVEYQVNVHSLESHKLLSGIFFKVETDGTRSPIIAEDFIDNGFILYGLPKGIVFDNKYYEILSTMIPSRMIRDSFKGVLIPNDEWSEFLAKWRSWYQGFNLNLIDPNITETPNFEPRKVKDWRYWLIMPEDQVYLYNSTDDITWIRLHEESKEFNSNRLAVEVLNWDPENSRLKYPGQCPKTTKLFQVMGAIFDKESEEGFHTIERQAISQLLILSEEYPYAISYNNEHILQEGNLEFRITVMKNPDNKNQYLLQGDICTVSARSKWKSVFTKKEPVRKAVGIVPSFLLHKDSMIRIGSMMSGRLINDSLTGVIVEENEISDFYATALPYLRQRAVKINDPQGLLRVSALYNYQLQGQMTIWEVKGMLMGRLKTIMHTDIGDFDYPLNLNVDEFVQTMDDRKFNIPKNPRLEQRLKEEIYEAGWVDEGESEYAMREDMALKFVLEILPNIDPERMVTYVGSKRLKRWRAKSVEPTISTSIQTGIDWFDVEVKMELDGQTFDLKQIVELWKTNEQAIELPKNDGIAVIDKEWITKYAPILNRLIESTDKIEPRKKGDEETEEGDVQKLKVEKFQMGLLNELEKISQDTQRDEQWEDLIETFKNFKGIKTQRIPKEVKATLRDYQKEGVNWLCFLREYGFGGILADDMGLGKTLQALTYLTIEKKKGSKKPNLVIAPTSVVTNWKAEVEKFVPHFDVVLLHGQKRKAFFEDAKKSDLIITTYGLLQRDLEFLSSLEYHVVILDEAQMIKNARSKTAQAVQELHGQQRITLTGTPIENSVTELWSQFNFLMPGFFGSMKEFEKNYVKPATKRNKKKKPDHGLLRRQTRPFILRRMKQHVAKELPPKTEQTLYCEMGEQQRKLYNSVMEIVKKQIQEKLEIDGLKGARVTIFDALLKLRQICCDPRLSTLSGPEPPTSAKLTLFMDTISAIVEEGHRVLVFSQFVKMLNLMHEELKSRDIPYLQLDGSTRDREGIVKKFQQGDEFPVFLISLKAGGTGINLTAADYVIHFDPWWNPAAEAQATDRAYRIGQKNHLMVYKLITRNSIEEKILDLQAKKMALAEKIVGVSDGLENMIDLDDIQEIFSL